MAENFLIAKNKKSQPKVTEEQLIDDCIAVVQECSRVIDHANRLTSFCIHQGKNIAHRSTVLSVQQKHACHQMLEKIAGEIKQAHEQIHKASLALQNQIQ